MSILTELCRHAFEVALQLFRLDKAALDSRALVSIDLAHLIADFGAVVEAAGFLVTIPSEGLLTGCRVTCKESQNDQKCSAHILKQHS